MSLKYYPPGTPIGKNSRYFQPVALQAETLAWKAAIVAAGSSISNSSLVAHDVFIKTSKLKGFRSQIQRLNTYGANDLTGSLIPIIRDAGNPSDTNNNFVSGDFSLTAGLTGDGATKYLDTGYLPSVSLTQGDSHLGVINGVFPGGNTNDIGVYGFPTYGISTLQVSYAGSTSLYAYDTLIQSGLIVSGTGFWVCNKIGTAVTGYRNAVSELSGTNNNNSVTFNPSWSILDFGLNLNGVPSQFTAATQQGYSIGKGLTLQQVTDYTAALNVLETALGRTYPI